MVFLSSWGLEEREKWQETACSLFCTSLCRKNVLAWSLAPFLRIFIYLLVHLLISLFYYQ